MKSIYKVEKIARIENSLDKHMDKLDILREKRIKKEKSFELALNKTLEKMAFTNKEKTTLKDLHEKRKTITQIIYVNNDILSRLHKEKTKRIYNQVDKKIAKLSNLV
jgi:hypothetical protein